MEEIKSNKLLCSCIYCKEVRSAKGIHVHVDRAHLGSTKYSSGNNGKYSSSEYKSSIKESLAIANDNKFGKFQDFEVNCSKCFTSLIVNERANKFPTKSKYYCSRSCANSHVVTDEHRKKTSESMTGREYVSNKRITTNCAICENEFSFIHVHGTKMKKCCSKKCSIAHGLNTKKDQIKKSRDNRTDLVNYRADCAFKFSLNDYPNEFDFTLIESYGWYKPKNRGDNLNGVSRDHMVSVVYGFSNNIPSEHLAHPANCRLMRHNDNVSKGAHTSISYEELLERIKEWDAKYNVK
jgi:hypothetical protein